MCGCGLHADPHALCYCTCLCPEHDEYWTREDIFIRDHLRRLTKEVTMLKQKTTEPDADTTDRVLAIYRTEDVTGTEVYVAADQAGWLEGTFPTPAHALVKIGWLPGASPEAPDAWVRREMESAGMLSAVTEIANSSDKTPVSRLSPADVAVVLEAAVEYLFSGDSDA